MPSPPPPKTTRPALKFANGYEPSLIDFRLTEKKRKFHDEYTSGKTQGNAYGSAIAAGFAESVAKTASHDWVPPVGTTGEMVKTLPSIAQAIWWTLHRRSRAMLKAEEKSLEQSANRSKLTRLWVIDRLIEIIERTTGRDFDEASGRDLASRMARGIVEKNSLDEKLVEVIADEFRSFVKKHRLFRPESATRALHLLGVDIGMFIMKIQRVPDKAVDQMSAAELDQEDLRLDAELSQLRAAKLEKAEPKGELN